MIQQISAVFSISKKIVLSIFIASDVQFRLNNETQQLFVLITFDR